MPERPVAARLPGALAAWIVAGILVAGMTSSTLNWYRDIRHYLDDEGCPVECRLPRWSELAVLRTVPIGRPVDAAEVRDTIGCDPRLRGYWDVYRIAFLSGSRSSAFRFRSYPNRFPRLVARAGAGPGKLLVLLPATTSRSREPVCDRPPIGGRTAGRPIGARIDWRPALTTVWKEDGRDPAELNRLQVVVP